MHIFNEMEMLNLTFRMQKGYPRIEAYGTMPTLPFIPTGVFKTYIIVKSWVNYKIKHVFNDVEMLDLSFKMLNGFPKLSITGTMPTVPFLPAGVFKTEVIANSRYSYEIKHIFNEMEMLKITVKMIKGFPRIEIAGKMPTFPIIPTGAFKTEIIAKSWKNYEIRHTFNGMQMLNLKIAIINGKMEMIGKYGMTHKTHLVMEYEYMRWVKIMLPTTNTWLSKELGIEMHYQPTNEAKLLEGGNIKIVAMHDNMPLMEIAGYFGLTWDSTVYEILVKDFHINLMNLETILPFEIILPEVKFYGKIFLDRQNRNGLLPKLAFEAQIHKDEKIVFHYLLTTVETPYKLHIFFPYFFQHVLHLTHEHLEITHEHIVLGNKQVIKTLCNLTAKKLIGTITPTFMSFELFDGELSLVKYVTELTKIEVGRNAMVLEGVKTVEFNAYQPMLLPKILGFNKLMTKFHLEVADKAAGKVNINVAVYKDTTELVKVVVNNVEAPHMIVLEAPVLALQMKYDYDLSTKVGNLMINDKTYMMVKPTVANEAEVIVFGFPVVKVALRADEVKITTIIPKLPEIEVAFLTNGIKITAIIPDLPEIAAAVTLKTFSLFQNTLGIQILVGKVSHKTLFGWNFNKLKKAFVDVKLIGSGIEILGDYEVSHHLNWNILGLKNIDVEWTGKVLCPGVKLFKTPMVTQGKLLFKNFVLDLEIVVKLMDVPYTLIFKTKPLTVALLPFFQLSSINHLASRKKNLRDGYSCETNTYDNHQWCLCKPGERVTKIQSVHSNDYEDRQWTFQCSKIQPDFIVGSANAWYQETAESQYDKELLWNGTTDDSFLVGMTSDHDNHYEDRKFKFFTARNDNWYLTDCIWHTVNQYDGQLDYTLLDDEAIGGLHSVHSNYYEDRVWDIQVCKLRKKCTEVIEIEYNTGESVVSSELVTAGGQRFDNKNGQSDNSFTATISQSASKSLTESYEFSQSSGYTNEISMSVSAGATIGIPLIEETTLEVTTSTSSSWSFEETWTRSNSKTYTEENGRTMSFTANCNKGCECALDVIVKTAKGVIPYTMKSQSVDGQYQCVEEGMITVDYSFNGKATENDKC